MIALLVLVVVPTALITVIVLLEWHDAVEEDRKDDFHDH
jgi:hypothetical protein